HSAPATTEVMSGANWSATTTTSWSRSRRHSAVVRPVTPAPMTTILTAKLLWCSGLGTPRAVGTEQSVLALVILNPDSSADDRRIPGVPQELIKSGRRTSPDRPGRAFPAGSVVRGPSQVPPRPAEGSGRAIVRRKQGPSAGSAGGRVGPALPGLRSGREGQR